MRYKKPKWKFVYNYKIQFDWKPFLQVEKELLWKDKYDTPRVELNPFVRFEWLGVGILFQQGTDQEWEQWLWVHKYNNGDEQQAVSTWPWTEGFGPEKGASTWKDYNNTNTK